MQTGFFPTCYDQVVPFSHNLRKSTRSPITSTLKKNLNVEKMPMTRRHANFDNTNSSKAKANLVSNVVIELFDVDKLLCHTLPSNDASTLHVAKFQRILYRLKQAPRQWYKMFDAFIPSHVLKENIQIMIFTLHWIQVAAESLW